MDYIQVAWKKKEIFGMKKSGEYCCHSSELLNCYCKEKVKGKKSNKLKLELLAYAIQSID